MKLLAAASLAKQEQDSSKHEPRKKNNQRKEYLLLNAPMGVGSRSSPQSWLQRERLVLSPSICRVLSMSGAAAETGDAGEHPGEHAVCRGGAAQGKGKGRRVGSTRS